MRKPILLFDLDNTILDFNSGERAALSGAFRHFGIEPTEEVLSAYHKINIKYWEKLETGELSRREVLEGRFDELFALYNIDCTGEKIQGVYEKELGKHHEFIDGAKELLEKLYEKNDLYIVSNGCTGIQKARIAGAGLEKYFKAFFISEEIGYDKPDVRFFDHCAARIPDFSKERAVIIGDSLTSDIRGGKNAGITTCWFDPDGRRAPLLNKPDYVINKLSELPEKLKAFAVV